MSELYTIIFGGSFDPPHLCHVNLALALKQKFKYRWFHIVPSGDHPEKNNHASFEHRHKMCHLAFKKIASFASHFASHPSRTTPISDLIISDREQRLESPTYTYDTLNFLDENGFDNLAFVIGSDLIHEVPDWEKGEKIHELATFIIIPRQGYPITNIPNEIGEDHEILNVEYNLPQLSSSYIRKIIRNGGDASGLLDRDVYEYIQENNLYRKE